MSAKLVYLVLLVVAPWSGDAFAVDLPPASQAVLTLSDALRATAAQSQASVAASLDVAERALVS